MDGRSSDVWRVDEVRWLFGGYLGGVMVPYFRDVEIEGIVVFVSNGTSDSTHDERDCSCNLVISLMLSFYMSNAVQYHTLKPIFQATIQATQVQMASNLRKCKAKESVFVSRESRQLRFDALTGDERAETRQSYYCKFCGV